MKSYKEFTQDISEEWVTMNDWVGDMFVNPTPRELSEYMKNSGTYDFAGILYDKDVYIFTGPHEEGVHEIMKHTNKRDVSSKGIRFRGGVIGGRIVELAPSGGESPAALVATEQGREKFFSDMQKVYTNKYLKARMGNFDNAFAYVRGQFKNDMEHFYQLKQKYKLT